MLLPLLLKPIYSSNVDRNVTLHWNKAGITIAGITGVAGNGSSELYNPWGLALTYDYTLYIADRYNHRVQKYFKDSSIGITVAGQANSTTCKTLQCLYNPSTIILDDGENLYIADSGNNRIVLWKRGASVGQLSAGTGAGNASNQFLTPYNIARDMQTGALYVSDYRNHRVMRYLTTGNNSGDLVAGGTDAGNDTYHLNYPMGISYESTSNSLLIANKQVNNIVRWRIGDNHWTLVVGSINGSSGNSPILFRNPYGFTMDPMGNLYVADSNNQRIQVFFTGQINGSTIAGITGGPIGNNNTQLFGPYGIILDNQLNLIVADTWNNRVQKFLRY